MSNTLRDINLNRLVVLVTVVEVGSFTGAAERLGMAKTMVSAHMQRLEAELGASLLVRTTRKLSLTDAGSNFFEAARDIVRNAEEAVNAIGQNSADPRGRLRIAAPVDYGASVIAPLAVLLMQRYPALNIELLSGDHLVDLVAEGIDVAIRLGKLADSNYQAARVADLNNWVVAAPALLKGKRKPTSPQQLNKFPYIALSVLTQPLSWSFEKPGKPRQSVLLEARLRANTAHAVRAAAVAGGGVAILPEFAIAKDVDDGSLVRLLPGWALPTGGVFAVFPATRYQPRNVRVLIDVLRAHVNN